MILCLFCGFLVYPVLELLLKSCFSNGNFTFDFYRDVFHSNGILHAIRNSFIAAGIAALITTCLAFILAYTIHYTNCKGKKWIRWIALLPMLLPTITYGFAILYSFGKEGLITKIFGHQLFQIYGLQGLLIGYVIYTLPVSFVLLYNAMSYIDKKFIVVSKLMQDRSISTFWLTIVRPLFPTLAASFIQAFFLSFTDFGIPAAVGGQFEVLASVLYDKMLGSVPNFNRGAVIALIMLIPSIVSVVLLHHLEKYNIRYDKISRIEIYKNKTRDLICGIVSGLICCCILMMFLVIFIVPFVHEWPYELGFTFSHLTSVFQDTELMKVYLNSLCVAFFTAILGTLVAYGSALVTSRSHVSNTLKRLIESIALITNTIPGMVLGLAFLFVFSGTSLQNTIAILVVCNVIHFFSTPYLMMKEALSKLNDSWETTALLMGDNWLKTMVRIVTPNVRSTLIEVFSNYFINAMVTISAVIFLAGARTMVITTKIKQLQYYNEYNEIFILSILLLLTNLFFKYGFQYFSKIENKKIHRFMVVILCTIFGFSTFFGGMQTQDMVVIYSNADDEAITAMKETLDENGYKGKYILQPFGTSELGGKILAEGLDLEADMITMSTFYIDSAQAQNQMFADLNFEGVETLSKTSSWCLPITAQEGSLIVNTKILEESNITPPISIKSLADPVYQNLVSVTDLSSSSTAWLMIQALIEAYGENQAKEILTDIYKNAGAQIEDSGSGPLKKIRAGEAAIGFGLRHQAIADKEDGLPVDYIDPAEGNFSLTESIAVLDRASSRKTLAMEMAKCIITKGRAKLQKTYPLALYEGETNGDTSAYPRVFSEPLTVSLLEKHQALSESCK